MRQPYILHLYVLDFGTRWWWGSQWQGNLKLAKHTDQVPLVLCGLEQEGARNGTWMLRCLSSAAGIFDCKEEKVGWCTERRNHARSRRCTLPHFWVAALFELLMLALYRNVPNWTQNPMGKMEGFYISGMRILEILSIWQMLNNLDSEVNDSRPAAFLNFCCVCHLRHVVLLSATLTASPWWIRIYSSLSPVSSSVFKRSWNFGVGGFSWSTWDIGAHTSQRDGADVEQKQESSSAEV